ncbi:hypothetical protein Tco_0638439 [Tanacetum coccineum]
MAKVHQAAQGFIEDERENIRARVEADEELTQKLQAEEREKYSEVDQAKMLLNLVNHRKRVHSFVPMDFELEVQRLKRAGQEVLEEPAKRQKIREALGSGEEQSTEKEKEVSEEELQKLLVIVLVEEVYNDALQVELKRLFEPDDDDTLWKLQRYMHDPLKLRLSDQTEEGPINFALMAYISSGFSSSSSSDSEVSTCSKAYLKSYETLNEHYDNLTRDFNKSKLNVGAYKAGLESVEARLDMYKKNKVFFEEDIKILKLDVKLRDNALTELRKKFEKAEKERDDLKLTLEKFGNSSKNLSKLLEIQVSDKFKTGVRFDSQVVDSQVFDNPGECIGTKYSEGYLLLFPSLYSELHAPKYDLVLGMRKDMFLVTAVSVNIARPINTAYPRPTVNSARTTSNVLNRAHSHVRRPFNNSITNKNSNLKEKVNTVKENVTTVGPKAVVSDNKGNEANVVKASSCWVWRPKQKILDHGNPQLELHEKGVIDSGCSRYMTGNKTYLSDYEEIDGGFVAFGEITQRRSNQW